MCQLELVLLEVLILLAFYTSQFQIALSASNRYMPSISALGVSPSLMPMYIQIEQLTVAIAQPIHCVSTLALLSMNAPIMASMKPSHLQPSIFL